MRLEEVDAQVALLRAVSRAMRARVATIDDVEACDRADALCREIEAWRAAPSANSAGEAPK